MNLLSAQYSSYPNLAELIKSKAWLVVNDAGLIKYSNQTFSDVFALSDNENIESIQLEPNLRNVIEKLSENNINNFSFDAIYEYNEEIINYKIEIEKILLFNDNYYVVVFDPLKEEVILEEKINNLHYALEYGQIPVLIIDTNGKISFSTNSFEKILDFDLGIIYNNHISSLLSVHLTPDELKELEIAIQRGNEWSGTISTYTANGQSSYFELKLNPLLKEENNSLNFILTAHDITYYIFKNKITQKSERRLKSIINNISDLLLILKKINDQIYFEDANDNFYETFKINKTEAAQRRFSDTLPEKLFLKIDETIKTLIKDNVDTMEFEFMDINERYYDGKVTSIDDLIGKDSIFVISFKDLTEKKKHEEQLKRSFQKEQQLNRLKTTFLQNMSHEIRTPVTAVMGYSEIMNDCIEEGDYETVVELTNSLKNVLNRVVNLFGNILEVSQLESGEIQMEKVAINCNQILKSIYDSRFKEISNKQIEFKLNLGDFRDLMDVDWAKFERVIINVLDNAIKYTNDGFIEIRSEKINGSAQITISDSGAGINSNAISQLMEPFVQEEDDGHSRNFEGAGLGLTIAYEYTKLMGGKMKIKSDKNVGTEVIFTFPLIPNI